MPRRRLSWRLVSEPVLRKIIDDLLRKARQGIKAGVLFST
jgi:hypothetical protein